MNDKFSRRHFERISNLVENRPKFFKSQNTQSVTCDSDDTFRTLLRAMKRKMLWLKRKIPLKKKSDSKVWPVEYAKILTKAICRP